MGKQRRRLTDLYKRGVEHTVDDGQGGITVWIEKLNDLEKETCLRRANAARARVLLLRNNVESEEWQSAYHEVDGIGDEVGVLIEYLIQDDLIRSSIAIEAELAFEDEWKKDSYLEGLRDAWQDGLQERYAADKDDEEASRVFLELKRFADIVDERVDGERVRLRKDLEDIDIEELRRRAVDRFIRSRGDEAWLKEFRRSEIWLAVREPDDHGQPYFTDRSEVDQLDSKVRDELLRVYGDLEVDPMEGKGSEEAPGSSPSSEAPAPGETDTPSGLPVAAQ